MVRPLDQVPHLQGVDVRRQGMRFCRDAASSIRYTSLVVTCWYRLISSNIENKISRCISAGIASYSISRIATSPGGATESGAEHSPKTTQYLAIWHTDIKPWPAWGALDGPARYVPICFNMTEVNMRPPRPILDRSYSTHIVQIFFSFLPPLNTAAQYWHRRKVTKILQILISYWKEGGKRHRFRGQTSLPRSCWSWLSKGTSSARTGGVKHPAWWSARARSPRPHWPRLLVSAASFPCACLNSRRITITSWYST